MLKLKRLVKKLLFKIEMEIEAQGLNSNMGSIFHGYLMENIKSEYADYFHSVSINPYTSCIYKNEKTGKFYWRITILNEMAYNMLMTAFKEGIPKSIYLSNKEMEVEVKSFTITNTNIEDIFSDDRKTMCVKFITPTSFKSNGVNHIYPNVTTLLQGIINKINTYFDDIELSDEKVIRKLLENVYIKDYNLRTQFFYLEKIKIKGFVGKLNIGLAVRDEALEKLLSIIIKLSVYTGFGMKTSLGMGAVVLNG